MFFYIFNSYKNWLVKRCSLYVFHFLHETSQLEEGNINHYLFLHISVAVSFLWMRLLQLTNASSELASSFCKLCSVNCTFIAHPCSRSVYLVSGTRGGGSQISFLWKSFENWTSLKMKYLIRIEQPERRHLEFKGLHFNERSPSKPLNLSKRMHLCWQPSSCKVILHALL